MHGWKVSHFTRALTKDGWRTPTIADGSGFPDLVLVKKGHPVMFRELKTAKGRLSLGQVTWQESLLGARADYAVIGDLNEVIPALVAAIRARTSRS